VSSDAFGTSGVILPLLVTGGVDPQVNSSLAEATQRLTAAEAAAKAMTGAWVDTKAKIDLASAAFQRIVGFVDQIAALTSEQQRLTSASQRLGLDFNQAADSAGRFVDETEAMAAASRLAEAGLHLTQEELNQLTARAAIASQRLGVDTTTAFNMLTTAIESGSTRALRPFGEDMVALGGSTHSAEERLSAFVTTTRTMERATDDASTSMARLRDSVGDAEREMAASFSAEVLRLQEVTAQTDRVSSRVDDTEHKLRALGQLAAAAATGTLNGIAVIVGAVAMGIVGTVATARGALAGLQAMAHGGSFTDTMAATVRGDDASRETLAFLEGRIAALNALADDNGSTAGRGAVRGMIGGASAGGAGASGDMVFGESQATADDAYAAAHRRRGATSGSGGARGETDAQRAARLIAEQRAANTRGREGLATMFSGATAEVAANAESEASANTATKAAEQQRLTRDAEARTHDAETRRARDQQTSIGAGMRSALTQYGDSAMHTRDLVVGAFSDMTTAVSKHIEAVVTGRETMGDALQGMLSDALGAIAKRASVSAAEELVSSIASLAVGDLRGAGLHAAAAVGFTAVAGLAGAASAAVAPAAPSAAAGHSVGSAAAPLPAHGGSSKDSGGQVVNVYFGGPVIGAGGTRQAARQIAGILNDGARQGGVSFAPQLIPVGP